MVSGGKCHAGLPKAQRKEAMYIIYSMKELYTLYNTILFVRELDKQGKYPCGISEIDKLKKYRDLVNKIMIANVKLKKNEKIQNKYPIQGPKKSFTFLKMLIRSGFNISSVEEVAISAVFSEFERYKNSVFADLDCCENLSLSSRVRDKLAMSSIDYRKPDFEYFKVGNRVLGVNNNHDRYVYDFSSASELNVDLVHLIKTVLKNVLSDIKWLFAFNAFQIYEINAKESLSIFIKYTLILKDILTQFNAKIKDLYDLMIIKAKKIGFTEKSIQRIMIYYHRGIDINQLLNEITESITKINSNYFKLKKLEIEVTINVRESANNLLLDAQHLAELIAKKDDKVVTYRAIYKHLPNLSARQFAESLRDIIQGHGLSSSTDRDERKNKSLPVLAAAWYLAETSRNPMTTLSSTMLIDIIEGQGYYVDCNFYSIENVLWHPDTIGDKHLDGTDLTQLGKADRATKYPLQEGWGGAHPMCHSNSYMRDFSEGNLWKVDDVLSVVRQKEVAIIIKWLFCIIKRFFSDLNPQIVTVSERTKKELLYNYSERKTTYETFHSYHIFRQNSPSPLVKEILSKLITPLFELRMSSFNNMIVPHAVIGKQFQFTNRYRFVGNKGVRSTDLKEDQAAMITEYKAIVLLK